MSQKEQHRCFYNCKALVIDDNEFIRVMAREFLQRLQFEEILEASNGEEAIKTLVHDLDIIICDINMEPLNGFGFLEHIKSYSNHLKNVPVLFLTGDGDEVAVQKAIELGVAGYLLKPLTFDGLHKKLCQLFIGHTAVSPSLQGDPTLYDNGA